MTTNPQGIIDIALLAGKTMLENGAETYRVEETVQRICESQALEQVNCFCVPTGIFLSVNFEGHDHTYVRRVKSTRIDLEIIAFVNDFSRKFTAGQISPLDALQKLDAIAQAPQFSLMTKLIFSGIAGSFFTLLFKGNFLEFVITFIVCAFTTLALEIHAFKQRSYFMKHVLGGIVLAALTLAISEILNFSPLFIRKDIVIIGALMPLVPGVAFTNALRDTISGDYLSGISKLSEAIAIAVAIALGVGSVLHFLPAML